MLSYLRLFLLPVCTMFVVQTAFSKVPIVPVPRWVKKQQLDYSNHTELSRVSKGYYFLHLEYQWSVRDRANYFHGAYKLVSDAGVEGASEITLHYDPAYQKILLHHVIVHRGNQEIDKLKTAKINELQQESDLYMHLYDGSKSVYILMDDIRMGDVVEYDYSIQGTNPVFGGRFSLWLDANMEEELPFFYCRVATPHDRPLHIRLHRTKLQTEVIESSAQTEYVWSMRNMAAIEEESFLPPDFDAYESIEVSEYDSWEDVQLWYFDLFRNADHSSAEIDSMVKSTSDSASSETAKILNLIHFVQNKVRYMGIEIGENSHRPFPAAQTFKRRFGDCKDKSVLLVSLLRKCGYTAYPALVNASIRAGLDSVLPSALRFNHVIVVLEYKGKQVWIDPTISYQGGRPDEICCPSYARALIVDGTSKDLTVIWNYSHAKTLVEEDYKVLDFEGHATLTIRTRYEGWDAEKNRNDFAERSVDDIQESYVSYYENMGMKIKPSETLSFSDNITDNIFIVEENYELENFWEKAKPNKIQASIYPLLVRYEMKKMYDPSRSMPMRVTHPAHVIEKFKSKCLKTGM